jgi:hypothetical protein
MPRRGGWNPLEGMDAGSSVAGKTGMDDRSESWRLGPYEVTRHLGTGKLTDRWLVIHEMRQSTHVLHEFDACHANAERRRFLTAIEAVAPLRHAHLLPVEELGFSGQGRPYVITPYSGSQDGLLTLERLAQAKGGRLSSIEVERGLTHLLQAVDYAHAAERVHGALSMDEVLVDRHGSLWIEMYGVGRRLRHDATPTAESRRDEVRSLVEMGYRLLTGIAADEPRIPAERLVKRLDRQWDEWFDEGLDPLRGFDSAAEALIRLPGFAGVTDGAPPTVSVRRVLGRFASLWVGTRESAARESENGV